MSMAERLAALLPPKLGEAFEALVKGRHISSFDGEVFYDLQQNFDAYRTVFDALGYELHNHPRGFFYFHKAGSSSDAVEQAAVFVWIMVDWMSDQGMSITEEITTREFQLSQLPHLQSDRYRSYMERLKLPDEAQMRSLLMTMSRRFGFIRTSNDYVSFRFLPAVYRLLDAAQEVPKVSELGGGGEESA